MGIQAIGSEWDIEGDHSKIVDVINKQNSEVDVIIEGKTGKITVDGNEFTKWVTSGKAKLVDASPAIKDGLGRLGLCKTEEASKAAAVAVMEPPKKAERVCLSCGGDLEKKTVTGNEIRWVCVGKGHRDSCSSAFAEEDFAKHEKKQE